MDLSTVVLVAATVTSGILAGTFLLYQHTVMPALRATDDATFVATFARLDRAIVNPWFMATGFAAAPVLALGGALLAEDGRGQSFVGAVLLFLVALLTIVVNVPRNDALKAADERGADPAEVRQVFDEARWSRANLVRVLLSVAATAFLAWGLTEVG